MDIELNKTKNFEVELNLESNEINYNLDEIKAMFLKFCEVNDFKCSGYISNINEGWKTSVRIKNTDKKMKLSDVFADLISKSK